MKYTQISLYLVIILTILNLVTNNLKFLVDDPSTIRASCVYDSETKKFTVMMGVWDEDAAAYGTYKPDMEQTGWDKLAITSYPWEEVDEYPDEVKAYAMGYLEGYLTFKRIWNHYQNCNANFNYPTGKMPDNTREFLRQNREFVYSMYKEHGESDAYWAHAYFIYRQYEGLIDAYNSLADADKQIQIEEAMIMNSHDITELSYWKNKHSRPMFNLMSHMEIEEFVHRHTHCSALVKVAADFSDIWFGHNTWTSFASMTRIFKEYRFRSNKNSQKARTVAMSSYPGAINSIDDFYLTSQDLLVLETTNSVFDNSLYDLLDPKTLLTWHRAMIANRLSATGEEWTQIFSKYNSGTYNNQFVILDVKEVEPDKNLIHDGALWIVEQIPGYTESANVTNILKYGYWPGFNSAYFKTIRAMAGYDSTLAKHPELKDTIDYETCARANIFRRDQAKVTDINSYQHLMRYNDYQNDKLSKNNPAYSIAARKDLDETKPDCRGATDAKIASVRDIKGTSKKKIRVISGPTWEQQEPFSTEDPYCADFNKGKYVFNGLPKVFKFDWVEMETTLFENH
jgi:hypothetical protein